MSVMNRTSSIEEFSTNDSISAQMKHLGKLKKSIFDKAPDFGKILFESNTQKNQTINSCRRRKNDRKVGERICSLVLTHSKERKMLNGPSPNLRNLGFWSKDNVKEFKVKSFQNYQHHSLGISKNDDSNHQTPQKSHLLRDDLSSSSNWSQTDLEDSLDLCFKILQKKLLDSAEGSDYSGISKEKEVALIGGVSNLPKNRKPTFTDYVNLRIA
jgi:hypothetical protein